MASRSVSRGRRSKVTFKAGTKRRGSTRSRSVSAKRRKGSSGSARSVSGGRTRSVRRTATHGRDVIGDDVTRSRYVARHKHIKKFMRGWKRVLAPRVIESVIQQRLTTPISKQGVSPINLFLAPLGTPAFHAAGSIDILRMFKQLEADEPTPVLPINLAARRMFLDHVSFEVLLRNATNATVRHTIYDIVPKRDSIDEHPSTVWTSGIIDTLDPTSQTPGQQEPNATPFDCQQFCQLFTVKKTTQVYLHPGSTHAHSVYIPVKRLINSAMFEDGNMTVIRNLTQYVMIASLGPIVQDTTTPFNITYGPAETDCIVNYRCKFMAMEKSRTLTSFFNVLPASISVQGQILEDTDAVDVLKQV